MEAERTAGQVFSGVGIKVKWHCGALRPGEAVAVSIQIDAGTLAESHPGALAFASPYSQSETRIHVLFDRVTSSVTRSLAGTLLGHVFAHEIAHVLEGYSRHSGFGAMKAHWDSTDFAQMAFRPLSFGPEDVKSIRAGMAIMSARPEDAKVRVNERHEPAEGALLVPIPYRQELGDRQ